MVSKQNFVVLITCYLPVLTEREVEAVLVLGGSIGDLLDYCDKRGDHNLVDHGDVVIVVEGEHFHLPLLQQQVSAVQKQAPEVVEYAVATSPFEL